MFVSLYQSLSPSCLALIAWDSHSSSYWAFTDSDSHHHSHIIDRLRFPLPLTHHSVSESHHPHIENSQPHNPITLTMVQAHFVRNTFIIHAFNIVSAGISLYLKFMWFCFFARIPPPVNYYLPKISTTTERWLRNISKTFMIFLRSVIRRWIHT